MGIFDHARTGVNSPFNTSSSGGGGGTPTGDPNTVAFFDNSGNLSDQVEFGWDGGTLTVPGDINPTGSMNITGNINPQADNTQDNGANGAQWANTWTTNVKSSVGLSLQGTSVTLTNGTNTASWDGTNLTVQGHIAPGTTNLYDLGLSAANVWRTVRSRTFTANDGTTGQMNMDATTGQTVPSGASITASLKMQQVATHMGIFTLNNSANNTTVTGDIYIHTGNKTVGTAASGSIWARTGTATGTRGTVRVTDGTEGTAGHVWTSTDTIGNGRWSAPAAAQPTFATTATAAGTTTLTSASATVQEFTGASAQNLRLPNATTLVAGQQYWVANRSSNTITIQLNDASTLTLVRANSQIIIILSSAGTTNGTWNTSHFNSGNVTAGLTWASGNTNVIDFNTSGVSQIGPGSGAGRVSINAASSLEYTGGGIQFQTAGSSLYLASGGDVRAPGDLKIAPGLATGSGTFGNLLLSNTHFSFISANGTKTVPTTTVNANAGTGATSVLGTGPRDACGSVTLTEGSAAWVAGAQLDITFETAYTNAPFVVITPTNAAAAAAAANVYVTSTTTKLTINFVNADVAANVYSWNYFVVGRA